VDASEKAMILSLVAESGLPRRRALARLNLPKSTYYRWLKRKAEGQEGRFEVPLEQSGARGRRDDPG
jgi:transposase